MEERISSQTEENLIVSPHSPQAQVKDEAYMSELPEVTITRDVIQKAKDGNRQAVSMLYRTGMPIRHFPLHSATRRITKWWQKI